MRGRAQISLFFQISLAYFLVIVVEHILQNLLNIQVFIWSLHKKWRTLVQWFELKKLALNLFFLAIQRFIECNSMGVRELAMEMHKSHKSYSYVYMKNFTTSKYKSYLQYSLGSQFFRVFQHFSTNLCKLRSAMSCTFTKFFSIAKGVENLLPWWFGLFWKATINGFQCTISKVECK